MSKKKEKSVTDLSLDLITNDMNLAKAFATIARSSYAQRRLAEGNSARTKSVRFYCEALRALLQLGERDRKAFTSDLEALRMNIEWLSMQRGASQQSFSSDEDASVERLLKLLEEVG
ncbi:MAG TPA: hypothetical protein VGK64_11630 [Bryobacteraceae bacterium]